MMKHSPIHLLYLMSFVDLLAVGVVIPQVANHVRSLGASHIFVGLMGSLYSGFQLFSSPIIGSLSDLKGRKLVLGYTLFVCAVCYLLHGITSSMVLLLVCRIILGIFKQTQMLTKALVADYEHDETKQAIIYGKMAAISGGGFVLGPIIGGHIMEDFASNGFMVNATFSSLLFLVNAAILWCLLPSTQVKKSHTQPMCTANIFIKGWTSLKRSVKELWSIEWSIYWDAFLFKALVGLCMGVYYSSYSLMLTTQFELTPKHVGYTISFQGVIGSICSYFIGYINSLYKNDHDYTQRNLHCFVLITLSLIGIATAWRFWVLVPWLIPLAVSNAVGRLITLEMVLTKSSGAHRAALIGASSSMRSMAGVIAPMLAGVVSDYHGIICVFYLAIAFSSIGLLLSVYTRLSSQIKAHKE